MLQFYRAIRRNATFVGLLLLVFMLTQYNAWTLTGVLEEKPSRIVEVLLAAITPARLLAGKVLGIQRPLLHGGHQEAEACRGSPGPFLRRMAE